MCETKPGPRCASDTRDERVTSANSYALAHPDGPAVNPVARVEALYPDEPGDYRGVHKAPRNDGYCASACDLTPIWGTDIYDHPEWSDDQVTQQDMAVLRAIRNNPDATVTVYRAVPKGVPTINRGDWVTTARWYAEDHGAAGEDFGVEHFVIEAQVRAGDLWNEGSGLLEFGWDPT